MAKEQREKSKSKYSDVFSSQSLGDHVDAYHEALEKRKDGGKYPVYMNLKPNEEAEVRFLDKEPVKFWQHRVYDSTIKNGQGGQRVFSCTRQPDCPLCESGDKPFFRAAWQVVHIDNLDDKGNVTPRVKLWVQGIRFAELFETKVKRFDPTIYNVILQRVGTGQNTQYTIDRTDTKGKIAYDQEEETDLTEYFGLDDEKFAAMERIAGSMDAGSKQASSSKPATSKRVAADDDEEEYAGPKKGKKSLLAEDENDDDVPF